MMVLAGPARQVTVTGTPQAPDWIMIQVTPASLQGVCRTVAPSNFKLIV